MPSSALTNTASRHVTIADGNLYYTQDSSMSQVGTGLPTGGLQTVTALPGVGGPPSGGNWNSPVLFDLNPLVAGVDTLYLGVQRHSSNELPAIVKYTFNGSTWSQAYTLDFGSLVGMLFLTGRVEGGNVVLYGATDTAGAPSFGNALVTVTDTGPSSAFTTLANAGSGYGFRGVAFAPQEELAVPEPSSFVLLATGIIGLGLQFFRRRSKALT
jgi:hypothetical protein